MILGITGMPGSGKSEFGKLLEKKKFYIFEMSSIAKKMMEDQKLPQTNVSIRQFSTNMRKKYGNDVFAKATVDHLKRIKNRNIAIVGIRSMYEIKIFRKHFKSIKIVALMSPTKIRFERLKERGKKGDPKSLSDFEYRENVEKKWGFPGAIKAADYLIYNTGELGDLEISLAELISS